MRLKNYEKNQPEINQNFFIFSIMTSTQHFMIVIHSAA